MIDSTLALLIYKVCSLSVGTLSLYWGFRLFMNDKWGDTGEIEGVIKDYKISFKRAAPGTFFSILGSLIIGITLYMGFYSSEETKSPLKNIENHRTNSQNNYESLPETPPN